MENPLDKLEKKINSMSKEDHDKLKIFLKGVSPEDGKYSSQVDELREFLSPEAEWLMCAKVQYLLLETRYEFGCAPEEAVIKLKEALPNAKAENMHLLEDILRHDQLAVIKELGRVAGREVESLLHPGTTSYDILDTARAFLFKEAWLKKINPAVKEVIKKLCGLAERSIDVVQVGRTHLQHTSPVTFGGFFAIYAARLAERLEKCNEYFNNLRGKISGITGTGAGIEQVIGQGKSIEFEKAVLKKLGLKPDYTATQITQKERLADVGHGLATLSHVNGDLANDIRILYSSDIEELTSLENLMQLGFSSTDANKNNPVNWEHIAAMAYVIESGMRVLYQLIRSDLQRDLQSSVEARYQPQLMMAQAYRVFKRTSKALDSLAIVEDNVKENLQRLRDMPSEAMVTILRGTQFIHSEYGISHDFVKEMSKRARKNKTRLLDEALKDEEFKSEYENKLSDVQRLILNGEIEHYLGSIKLRADINISYAKMNA